MKTLFLYSKTMSERMDPSIYAAAMASAGFIEPLFYNVDEGDAAVLWDTKHGFELVIVWNALNFYLQHRMSIVGHPKIVVASWHYEDLHALLSSSVTRADAGIDALFSNSKLYVEQSSAVWPTRFSMKPVTWAPNLPKPANKVGTIVTSTSNRDFSQLVLTAQHVAPENLAIFADDHCIDALAPLALPFKLIRTLFDYNEAWAVIKHYVPCPLVTDYRYRITPPEILEAIANRCQPWLLHHPALLDIQPYMEPFFGTLTAYVLACKNPDDLTVKVSMPNELMVDFIDFFKHVREVVES